MEGSDDFIIHLLHDEDEDREMQNEEFNVDGVMLGMEKDVMEGDKSVNSCDGEICEVVEKGEVSIMTMVNKFG